MGRIQAIDSHTGGEPTRVILDGFPNLGGGSVERQAQVFKTKFDHFRRAVILEPRGSDILVGALLVPASTPGSVSGVIFFNSVGLLGMCGHGTIGVVETLAHLGRFTTGAGILETPVGDVQVARSDDGKVSVRNVASSRYKQGVIIQAGDLPPLSGDVSYGGNWFFISKDHGFDLRKTSLDRLTRAAYDVRNALVKAGITGEGGAEIDHVEFVGPSEVADAQNFVLCPGTAYDRSPCGTGTSAKIACLAANGDLAPGQRWTQESITGSIFEASYEWVDGSCIPTIVGTANVTAELSLILAEDDPLRWGRS